ncbi:cytochrome b/b6 domain-containing protein [Sphingomonas alpina]|uniref:YceI family protein n=1 Tax=Sphingomonas alpina TaxID=653931 RepID=A0A7H0LJ19_9SPHN|nr:cytochrome b/b6 domain-containing protein [Sphingomonas alpina]QNQ09672.1 YceI family protein [Sphingomonas alpina]
MTDPSPIADPASSDPVDAAATPATSALSGARSYTRVAIALHWIIALCLLGQIALGWGLNDVPDGPARYAAFQLHKSIGISILLLSVARLAWRLLHPAPPGEPMPRWQRLASGVVHWGLYAIMIGLPATGWIMVSTSKLAIPTRLFGLVPWPSIPGLSNLEPATRAIWNSFGSNGHAVLVYVTIALLVLHLGAVLKHQLIDRDRVFARMAPGALPGWKEPRFWGLAALALIAVLIGSSLARERGPHRAATQRPTAQLPAALGAVPTASPASTVTPSPGVTPLVPTPTPTPAESAARLVRWTVQDGQLGFSTNWADTPITGSFSRWTADIVFSPELLDRSSLTVRIDLASVSTGDSQRDAALPTSDWFDVATHPSAVFRSERIRSTGGDNYVASGTLDLRGIRKKFSLPFTVRIKDESAAAHGTFTIDRTLFGVGQGEWSTTDQIPAAVAVKFSLRARGTAAK